MLCVHLNGVHTVALRLFTIVFCIPLRTLSEERCCLSIFTNHTVRFSQTNWAHRSQMKYFDGKHLRVWYCFQNQITYLGNTLILYTLFLRNNANDFRGELTNVSAITQSLTNTQRLTCISVNIVLTINDFNHTRSYDSHKSKNNRYAHWDWKSSILIWIPPFIWRTRRFPFLCLRHTFTLQLFVYND